MVGRDIANLPAMPPSLPMPSCLPLSCTKLLLSSVSSLSLYPTSPPTYCLTLLPLPPHLATLSLKLPQTLPALPCPCLACPCLSGLPLPGTPCFGPCSHLGLAPLPPYMRDLPQTGFGTLQAFASPCSLALALPSCSFLPGKCSFCLPLPCLALGAATPLALPPLTLPFVPCLCPDGPCPILQPSPSLPPCAFLALALGSPDLPWAFGPWAFAQLCLCRLNLLWLRKKKAGKAEHSFFSLNFLLLMKRP